jgi:hypothetical protein
VAHLGDCHPAKLLDPFGQRVNQFQLLASVLVEQQMQLLEGRATHLPVMLLVQAVENHGVG